MVRDTDTPVVRGAIVDPYAAGEDSVPVDLRETIAFGDSAPGVIDVLCVGRDVVREQIVGQQTVLACECTDYRLCQLTQIYASASPVSSFTTSAGSGGSIAR